MSNNEQKLVDILFEIALKSREDPTLQNMDDQQYTEWIREQLNLCGFEVAPCGASHGVLRQ